jgi:hypothetical protein
MAWGARAYIGSWAGSRGFFFGFLCLFFIFVFWFILKDSRVFVRGRGYK